MLLIPGFLTWRADRRLPHYEGRSASAWFQRFHREYALDRISTADPATLWDCKTAFLEMQPAALPFLVKQALTPRHDSAVRTNLHRAFSQMPSWAGRGLFAPESFAPYAAWELIRTLRPPAPLLLPLLEPAVSGNDTTPDGKARFESFHAAMLLGYCSPPSDPAAQRLIVLLDTYRSPITRNAITNSLRELAPSSPVARAWALRTWDEGHHPTALFRLAQLLGPEDLPFVPRLESLMSGTNDITRLRAAVALLRIQPEHQGALAELIQVLPTSDRGDANGRLNRSRSEAAAWLGGMLQSSADLKSQPLQRVLEPLLREEIQQWNPRGATYRFVYPMARLAPERTEALLREALPREGGALAAGFLLLMNRGDPDATRRLVEALESAPGTHIIAFQFLRNFSSTNQAGMRFLQDCLDHPEALANRGTGQRIGAEYLRTVARQALAEIRYREARQRHGLPEEGW